MPENKPRDLMATLMDGGVPDRIPYSVGLMPQVFRERMENELGLPLEEAYSIDLGTRSAGPLSRGKPPWDLPWNNAPDNEQHESWGDDCGCARH